MNTTTKRALFSVSAKIYEACQPKLVGLDYEASTTADGKTTFIVVRDSSHYVGDPIAYVSKVLNQKAVKACC